MSIAPTLQRYLDQIVTYEVSYSSAEHRLVCRRVTVKT